MPVIMTALYVHNEMLYTFEYGTHVIVLLSLFTHVGSEELA